MHDITISLIPYTYHAQVIKAAIKHRKHVVTTSYINPQMAALDQEAKAAGITVMNEIGVDPGIDHLYAVKTIDEVHREGGKILSFVSYCGGLPAPEDSNNPLGYKFSWSSRGVLLALRNSARFLQDGAPVEIPGPQLMKSAKPIYTGYPAFAFVGYPNRDSTPYVERYGIPEAKTVLRGTLRYQGFPVFVQALVDLGLLQDEQQPWLSAQAPVVSWRSVLCRLCGFGDDASAVTDEALLSAVTQKSRMDQLTEAERKHVLMGFRWLGLFSAGTQVPRRGSYLDALCATLEEKMKYGENERDMVMLQHNFLVETAQGARKTILSTLLAFGQPQGPSAMATTVGVPCGLATQLVLDGLINERGVIAPMSMRICQPLIDALEQEGIRMTDEVIDL